MRESFFFADLDWLVVWLILQLMYVGWFGDILKGSAGFVILTTT